MKPFATLWSEKVAKIRQSDFWHHVSTPPTEKLTPLTPTPSSKTATITPQWTIQTSETFPPLSPAAIAVDDLKRCLKYQLNRNLTTQNPQGIIFFQRQGTPAPDRWHTSFNLNVTPHRITISAPTDHELLLASLYISNTFRLTGTPSLPLGKRHITPRFPIMLSGDLWGGFSTTQAWIDDRENDENFLELTRMGVNAIPVMTRLEDYFHHTPRQFTSLINPQAQFHRQRLARLAQQARRFGISIFLMAYNPKLTPNHQVFTDHPASRGAIQAGNAFRVLCPNDPATRRFLTQSWASLFHDIPELGGMLTIIGGEGFYHCYMRSTQPHADDCPRCRKTQPSSVIAQFINQQAQALQKVNHHARIIAWPYSAGHWSHDRDQQTFIEKLQGDNILFQSELDKDSLVWNERGYAKHCWDYSAVQTDISPRARRQRQLCRQNQLAHSAKIQINNTIECLNVPYLPTFQNQKKLWENVRKLTPHAVHSCWMFTGSCKSPAEEMGYWTCWGKRTEFDNLNLVLKRIAQRDFGKAAAPSILKAWNYFSQAMSHHPNLHYYIGSYFIGPGQPLILNPDDLINNGPNNTSTGNPGKNPASSPPLDPAFFGQFYWLWEESAGDDTSSLENAQPLFFSQPGFNATCRRGPHQGQDLAIQELRQLARLWQKGTDCIAKASPQITPSHRPRYRREKILAQYLAYTWHSAANVEEFLRLRNDIRQTADSYVLRSGYAKENRRDLKRLKTIAQNEIQIAQNALKLVQNVDYLDLSLRLDMGTAPTTTILNAKIKQVQHLLRHQLPRWEKQLLTW